MILTRAVIKYAVLSHYREKGNAASFNFSEEFFLLVKATVNQKLVFIFVVESF